MYWKRKRYVDLKIEVSCMWRCKRVAAIPIRNCWCTRIYSYWSFIMYGETEFTIYSMYALSWILKKHLITHGYDTQDLEIWLICSTPWPTKNLFGQMFCTTFTTNQRFPHSLRNACFVIALSWTCIGVKSRMSVVGAFTVIISHLVS